MKHNPTYAFTYYRVGGAVRDALLGYPSHETDYVVVGETPEAMLKAGFLPVGKSFPVFLHPHTKEEYALARSERKVAKGYHGFEFHADPSVTLEEDLKRRDLTINAMAMDAAGNLTDPYGGKRDLEHRILRHVSDAFVEDPVRILRIARFAARFHHLGFTIADETMALMKDMVNNGEVNALVAERVWKETEKAFEEKNPEIYIQVLHDCGALAVLMPELDERLETPSLNRIAVLKNACALPMKWDPSINAAIRFAVLAHGLTIRSNTVPPHWQIYIEMFNQHEEALSHWATLHSEALLNLLNGLDAFRRGSRFLGFLDMITALYTEQASQFLLAAYQAAAGVSMAAIPPGLTGLAIKEALHQARVKAIDAWHKSR